MKCAPSSTLDELFARYVEETEGFSTLRSPVGFATYRVESEIVYLRDIYTHPDYREGHEAARLADQVCLIARNQGARAMLGSVSWLSAPEKADRSIKVLHGYGMRFIGIDPERHLLVFRKELT